MKRETAGTVYRNKQGEWLGYSETTGLSGITNHEFFPVKEQDRAMLHTPGGGRNFEGPLHEAVQKYDMQALNATLITERIIDVNLPEKLMTEEELQWKYGQHLGDSSERQFAEHPDFSYIGWRDDVREGMTLLGYWPWVMEQIQQQT